MKNYTKYPKCILALATLSVASTAALAEETYKTIPYTNDLGTKISNIQASNKDLFVDQNLKVTGDGGSIQIGNSSGDLSVGTLNIGTNDADTAIIYKADDGTIYKTSMLAEESTKDRQVQHLTSSLVINGNADGIDYALILDNYNYLSSNDWSDLTINGNLLQLGSESTIKISKTITVNGKSTLGGDVIISNTNNTGASNLGKLSLVAKSINAVSFDAATKASLTVTNNVTLDTTNDEIRIVKTSGNAYSNYGINIIDGDVFADKKIIIEAGDDTTTNVLYLRGDQSKVDTTKWVRGNFASMAEGTAMQLGSIEFNNNTMLMIDLETDVYDDHVYASSHTQEIIIDNFLFGESFAGTSAETSTAILDLANFENDLLKIGSDYSIYTTETGENYLVINGNYIQIKTDLASDLDYTLVNSDGYLNYETAVPEPSTYAMIFGALALGLAFYRKRK